ncbi:MAG: hypothetical protein AB1510_07545 [Bacillota bacterium]
MTHMYWLEKVRRAMCLELREIKLMAQLAEEIPTAGARMQIIEKIAEEASQANTWNCILACFEGMPGRSDDAGERAGKK